MLAPVQPTEDKTKVILSSSNSPDDWTIAPLGKVANIQIGGTPSRKMEEYWDNNNETENYWVSIADLKTKTINSTKEKISNLGIQKSNCKLVPANTLMMSFKLSIGRVAFAGKDLYTNEAIAAFLTDKNKVDDNFLYYLLPILPYETDVAVKGQTLNKEKLQSVKLPLPPLPEQQKIAEILSTVDAKIESIAQRIVQTEQLKKGLMQKLLTEGIGHTEFKDSELGRIPENWQIVFLDNAAKRGSGHTPNKKISNYWDGGIKWISLADSKRLDQIFIHETDKEISKEGIQNSSAVLHPAGTVVISRDAGVGKSAIMASEMCVSQHFIAWQCGEKLSNLFLYYLLQQWKPMFETIAAGTTIKTIGLSFFQKLKIPLPPIEEQNKIANLLLCLDDKLNLLYQLKSEQITLKKGLMQKLLTGQIRVKVS